jgi:ubiquinone/menaquinone biosynthesis C-methylase UbiE
MKKLNLGCGTDYINGWVNVDSGNCRCDINHNIETFPWPFDDNSVSHIKMQHILEHISKENFIPLMREIYRVCCDGAQVGIISPHAGSNNFWTDITHKLPLTVRTFDYFDKTKPLYVNGKIYGWDDIDLTVSYASEIPNEPNGPDVMHKLIINKK